MHPRTLPYRAPTPAVEYFGGVPGNVHSRLVQAVPLSDKWAMGIASNLFRTGLDLVLPERCPSCGTITAKRGPFCVDCWQQLHFLNPPWCSGCAVPFAFEREEGALCASCLSTPPRHDGIRAAVRYDEISKQVALRLKYGGKIGLGKMIANQLIRHLPHDRSAMIVTPVPLHWTRLWGRSFNQSALIAEELALAGGMEYIPDLLLRTKRTPSLRGLNAKERRKAVGKAFVINQRRQTWVKGSRIILVDDVLTTGATSDGCVAALKKAGANWVQLFCWARALRGEATDAGDAITLDA